MMIPIAQTVFVQLLRQKELQEQDKSSDIEQQPPFGDRKISNIRPQNREGGYKTIKNII